MKLELHAARPVPEPQPTLFKYCICGHYWHDHETGKSQRYKGFFGWFRTMGSLDGPCRNCMCPGYLYLGSFTTEEFAALKEQAEKEFAEDMVYG